MDDESPWRTFRERRRAKLWWVALLGAFGAGAASAGVAVTQAGWGPPTQPELVYVVEHGPPWVPVQATRNQPRKVPVAVKAPPKPKSPPPAIEVRPRVPTVTVRPKPVSEPPNN